MRIKSKVYLFVIMVALLAWSIGGWAQTADQDSSSEWKHSLVLYLLAPSIDGTVGVGPINGDIVIDRSTVLKSLDAGFLGVWAVEKGDWGVLLDVIYLDLSEAFHLPGGLIPGEFGNTQLITGLYGQYRLTNSLQLMAGVMYTDVSLKLPPDGPPKLRYLKAGDSWADPVVGLRYAAPISDRWSFDGFGQVGGFGVSSDLVWQLTGSFSYRMTKRSHFLAGYRYMDFDYESGSGIDRFKFDVVEHGPALGFRINF
jgi:hypothetical protein